MRAEIISVGTELLLGEVTDTNAPYLSQQMAQLGIDVYHRTTVGDNEHRLVVALEQAQANSDLVIITGGLGPTADDITKQVVARFVNQPLECDQVAANKIAHYFAERNEMPAPNNRTQAEYINGGRSLANSVGLAVGTYYYAQATQTHYVLLPGPPQELQVMVEQELMPVLRQSLPNLQPLFTHVMRFFGISESRLAALLADVIAQQSDPTIALYAQHGEVTIRLASRANTNAEAEKKLMQCANVILERAGQYYYGHGADNSLANVLVQKLQQAHLTIAAAESLTAGLFQSTLATIPGVSAVFYGGFVTYATEAKERFLGVPHELIAQNGVVSQATAQAMAQHTQKRAQTDIAVSFTGVAGPGQVDGLPAGTVWIGLQFKDQKPQAQEFHWPKMTRQEVRQRAVLAGLMMVLQALKKQ